MTARPRNKIAQLQPRADNVPAVDPRLDPFLHELARLLWRDVKHQIESAPPKKKQEER